MKLSALLFATALCVPATAAAEWIVDPKLSSLHYVSTKKTHVAEGHVLSDVTGSVSDDGELTIVLGSASANSGVAVRDARMRKVLFQADAYPTMTFAASIDLDEYADMAVGEAREGYVDGVLSFLGREAEIDFDVIVTRTGVDRVLVASSGAILIDAARLSLDGAINELKALAELPSISYAVPIYASVTFSRR